MTDGFPITVYLASIVCIAVLPSLLVALLVGNPPKHCRYMVAIKPGVYACSMKPVKPVRR